MCVSLPVIYFFFKETTQKSLEEIDLLFGSTSGMSPKKTAKPADLGQAAEKETGITVANVEHTHTGSNVDMQVKGKGVMANDQEFPSHCS